MSTSAINSALTSTETSTSSVNISNILAASTGSSTTGIDVTSAVAAAIYADRAPERAWEADQTTLTSQTTALTSIQTATQALATDLENLNTLSGPLSARTVTSSNSSDLSATAATGTTTGTHTVIVNSLAATGSWYSDLESSATSTLPSSSLTITTNAGAKATFATAGDTLNSLASAINSSSLGVTATVVTDSTGSRLAIISNSSGSAADFSISSSNFTGTSWTSPDMATGDTLGANSVTLTSSAGTVTLNTTSGETYAQLAAAINNATVATSYTSAQASLTSSTPLTSGSVTTIQDGSTGKTFTYTATAGATVGDLNNAIAAAVTAGTLSANVTGSVSGGSEVISEGSTDQGIAVSSNDSVLGAMSATAGATTPLGLTATAGSDSNGTNLSIASSNGSSFTINEPAFGFTQAVAGANASLTVDGVPVSSASNTVTGAISGVTLSLLGADPDSEIDLTVASDASSVSTAINQFVTDYNTALGLVNKQFTDTTTTGSSGTTSSSEGVLASDPTLVSLQSTMESALGYVYSSSSGTTTVSNLSDLGLTVADSGTLTVDTTTLDNALTNNPTDVQNFFEGSALNGFANSMYNALNTFTEPDTGAFTLDLSSISSASKSITSEINQFETGYIASQQTVLTADYTEAEVALQELPQEMQELNSELGFTNNSSNG
jgi:flagellar hook-associated protein 2